MSKHLFIAVPIHGMVDPGFHDSCLRLFGNPPFDFTYRQNVGDPAVNAARNTLVAEFLKTDCDKMLFIDSDIGFNPTDVERIASHSEELVSGLYCKKKTGAPEWTVRGLPGSMKIQANSGLAEVEWMATGFMCIARSVFEKLAPTCDEYEHEDGTILHGFFNPLVVNRRLIGDDFSFCKRWRDIGGKCWLDTNVILKHYGPVAFPVATNQTTQGD